MICINHFENDCYEIKSRKYYLKNLATPTIFREQRDENKSTEVDETDPPNETHEAHDPEKEIKFLREYVAKLESEKETTEKRLKEIIELQSSKISNLRQENDRITGKLKELCNDEFVCFAIGENPKVH